MSDSFKPCEGGLGELLWFSPTPVDEVQEAGYKSVEFDASGLPSGMYLYRLQACQEDGGRAGSYVQAKKMVVLQ